MHNVISYYALTDGFRQRMIESFPGELNFVPIGRLRNLGLTAMLRKIRGLKADHITVAIESDNSRPLTGPLMLVAALTGSRKIDILWPDGGVERVSYFTVASHVMRLLRAQISARLACRAAARTMKKLEVAPRSAPSTIPAEKPMILYLDANLAFGISAGGSVGHIKGVIEGFVRQGFEVDYAACKTAPSHLPQAHWLEVKAPDLYGFPPEINCYTFNRRYENFLSKRVKERPYSFIYQRMSVHNCTGATLREKTGIPLVLEYNGSEVWTAANWNEKLRLHDIALMAEARSLQYADVVVTVSKVLAGEVAAAGVPRERIVAYPNCIDPSLFDPARFSDTVNAALRKRLGIAADAKVATFIGTFGMWHGVDFLARAVRRLILEEREWLASRNLHFLFVGDGLKMPEVKELLRGEPFDEFVTLTGLVPQAEAPAYLAASDIFLSPHVPNPDGTAFFGSPTKLFEYMAMERPIVASDLDQIGAVLKGTYLGDAPAPEGPLGELFAPADQQSFLDALRKVVENPETSIAMAKRARQAALGSYTWEHHVSAILDRLRTLDLIQEAQV